MRSVARGFREVESELRQRLGREIRRDRVILQLRAEFVTDLLVNRIDDLLAR